jgi:hypothetical protein
MVSTAQDIMSRYGIDQDFAASIESLGNDLGVDPMYLANTMYAESRLDPSVKNMAGSGATGLIQFMPQTAANLGTTTDELSRMTPVEQMEYVRRYFSADNLGAGRLRDLQNDPSQHNVNMAVFLPSMISKPVDTQIPQEYWRQNGSIRTPADYTRSAEERVNAYIQSKPVDTQTDTVDAQTDKMLSKEQPEDTFRPEVVPASLDTDAVISSTDEEVLEVDDTLMAEHEEKIRRGEAPRGSKPTEEGGYYTEGEYGFRTNPEGEVVADSEVNSLENVATSVGERLRTILGNNEDSETLELNEGGSVEKEVKFVKEDDDDVPDPPPGATPEEVADDIPAYLSTGEYVLPANVVRYIGLKNITDMHQRALAELQQMEDLDIIENVDENGYVEEDDDEMDYMKPEGVVEIVVAEHPPKGLMAMGFAEGGLVEAMVYVPGVGFVPQTQAAYLSSKKDEDKDEEQEDTDKSILEGGESQGDTNDVSEGGPLGKGYASRSEMVNDPSFQSQAKAVTGLFGTPLAVDIATGALKGFKEQFDLNDLNEQIASDMAAATDDPGTTGAPGMSGVGSGVEGGLGTTGGHDDGGEDSSDSAEAEAEADADASELKRGGYVTRNGIMARGYSEGGEAGDTAGESGGYGGAEAGDEGGGMGGPGGTDELVEYLESEVEEEKPTDPYEGYTYVKGIGYVPTSRRRTSDKPVDSASLALSSIFTPGFLETIGLMSDPNKEL